MPGLLVSPARPATSTCSSVRRRESDGGCSGVPSSVTLNVADTCIASTAPLGFLMSSRFSDIARGESLVADSKSMTSPARWRSASTDEVAHNTSQNPQPKNEYTLSAGQCPSFMTSQGPMTHTYMKEYDYTQPTASTTIHRTTDDTSREAAERPTALPKDAPPSEVVVAIKSSNKTAGVVFTPKSVSMSQQTFSGQRRRAEKEQALKARCLSASPRQLLYQGLPYTWRELVPFACPVRHPEIMSYDANSYHSIVAKQCRDIGMRVIDLTAGARNHRSLEGLDLNAERGVTALSLRKHSQAYRMQQMATYPGLAYGLTA